MSVRLRSDYDTLMTSPTWLIPHGGRVAVAVLLVGLAFGVARRTKTIRGRVTDFETHEALSGVSVFAYQSGWGISGGGVVWDKSYPYRAVSGPTGEFTLRYRVGSSARLGVDVEGYNAFRAFAAPGSRVEIRLKRLPPPHGRLPSGQVRFGLKKDGSTYGFAFDRAATASSCADADVVPVRVDGATRGPIVLRACGRGGLHYVTAESLGVTSDYLVYGDTAPEDGYAGELSLDFSTRGGLVFVRTRDGMHYAKFEFTPSAFGGFLDRDVARDVAFTYVFDPSGSRYLPYEVAPRVR